MTPSVGSLCTGIRGLDLAVEAHFGAELAWYSEVEPAPCTVLEREVPGVPNLGDLTTLDWSQVEPVDILTAGYPCQPFSHAGKRKGQDDARHLWPFIAEAVRVLRPRRVVLENVAGHLTLGFGDVLRDLAEAGFDAEWCVLRASDVGAPHRRERLFIAAGDTDVTRADPHPEDRPSRDRTGEPGGLTADTRGGELQRRGERQLVAGPSGSPRCEAQQRERDGHAVVDRRSLAADTDEPGLQGPQPEERRHLSDGCVGPAADTDCVAGSPSIREHRRCGTMDEPGEVERTERLHRVAWGQYEPAIHRWELALGRVAPEPTDEGRLSPSFVEWMMGYPAGWVDGLTRTAALKALGNAVVPQQAAAALRELAA